MTREEAKEFIQDRIRSIEKHFPDVKDYREALEMAIKALEQEPCEDCISRKAVECKLKSLVNEMETIFADIRESKVDDSVCGLCEYDCDHGIDGFANECPGFECDDCFKLKDEYRKEWESIKDLPSVTPQQKTGRWIELDSDEDKYDVIKCPCCKHTFTVDSYHWTDIGFVKDDFKYCPNCGKRMEG